MAGSLDILERNKNDLLLAEVAAWLHDMGKSTDVFIQNEDARGFESKIKNGTRLNPHKAVFNIDELEAFSFSKKYKPVRIEEAENDSALHKLMKKEIFEQLDQKFSICGVPYTIRELIYFGRPGMIGRTNKPLNKEGKPVEYLGRCHGAAHIEKEDSDDAGKQLSDDTRPSSPFGFEGLPLKDLTNKLKDLPYDKLGNRSVFQEAVQSAFGGALGDTRRPINEVTLWDWAHIVAALYKAALAGALLQQQNTATPSLPDPKNLKWRLLALRFDGGRVVDRSHDIQALLARREWVEEGLDKAKRLLEEDYPLGTEVYRDSNGALFVVPDTEDLLEYANSGGKTLKSLIHQELNSIFDGELVITPQLDHKAWWAQDPNRSGKDMVPPIAKWLRKNETANLDPAKVKGWWQNKNAEPCRISGVRPQGPSQKGIERKLSDFWLERTGKRSKEWAEKKLDRTTWMSEVADINGRVALIAAKLDLKHWLAPDGLVNTLLVMQPQQGVSDQAKKKAPSFARLRRIWETCAEFWKESVEAKLRSASLVGEIVPRLVIKGVLSEELGRYHAYEIQLKTGVDMEVVWAEGEKKLIVITNLQYLARILGAKPEEYSTLELAADWLKQNYLQDGKELKIYEPEDSGGKRREAGYIRSISVNKERHDYMPAISVLSEPQQFMVLVPTDKALAVARHIKSEYEVRFSKVKNRLPLHLNLLFFGRKQPLYAALDAARRMLERDSRVDTAWVVEAAGRAEAAEICRHSNGRLGNRVISLRLRRKAGDNGPPLSNAELETMVSYSTGDPNTEDVWYPYLFVPAAAPGVPLESRQLSFKASLPGCSNKTTLVHIKEVKEGDEVCYAPSTFDFEFLDVTARRFELVNDQATGMRLPRAHEDYATRPFLLEDLDVMQELWALAAENTTTRRKNAQLQQITGLIEEKRRDWRSPRPNDNVLSRFADQVLRRSFGKLWNEIPEMQRTRLTSWAASGRWRDLMELYISILKLPESETFVKEQEVRL